VLDGRLRRPARWRRPPVPLAAAAVDRGALLPAATDGRPPAPPGCRRRSTRPWPTRRSAALAVSVVDAVTGEPLLERAADVPARPGVDAKIATAVAALTGPAGRPAAAHRGRGRRGAGRGRARRRRRPDARRAVDAGRYPQPARLADLAAQARSALGAAVVSRVVVDDSLYTGERLAPGWKPTYVTEGAVAPVTALMVDGGRLRQGRGPRTTEPALDAGRAFAALLQPGAAVEVVRGTATAGAAPLAEVASAPVPQLVERMLVRATTTSPRRSRGSWRSRPAGPRRSSAPPRRWPRCSRSRWRRRASARTPSGSSTAAGCRATTAPSRAP
jgi:D-alanyl-D-alanine carboxypeptidase